MQNLVHVWTRVVVSISYDDNNYATNISKDIAVQPATHYVTGTLTYRLNNLFFFLSISHTCMYAKTLPLINKYTRSVFYSSLVFFETKVISFIMETLLSIGLSVGAAVYANHSSIEKQNPNSKCPDMTLNYLTVRLQSMSVKNIEYLLIVITTRSNRTRWGRTS